MRFCVAILVAAVLWLAVPAPGRAQSVSIASQGNMVFSASGGFSSNSITLGGSFGYFVLDRFMPGVRYYYTYQDGSGSVDSIEQHQTNLFLRYYFVDAGDLYPFVTADGGYLYHNVDWAAGSSTSYSLYSVAGGAGVVAFLAKNFGVEFLIGIRRYVSVPAELEDADFDKTDIEWSVGFGLYF